MFTITNDCICVAACYNNFFSEKQLVMKVLR